MFEEKNLPKICAKMRANLRGQNFGNSNKNAQKKIIRSLCEEKMIIAGLCKVSQLGLGLGTNNN